MKPVDRLFLYLENQGIRPTAFEKKAKISNGYLGKAKARNSDIGGEIIDKILQNAKNLNREWLLLGKGEMLKNTELLNKKTKNQEEMERKIKSIEQDLSLMKNSLLRLEEDNRELRMVISDFLNKQTRVGG